MLNEIISNLNELRYTATEPIKLKLARRKWEYRYNPLISVYIPTLNRPRILWERGLKSVLDQTYNNIEIIIVDDGSDDILQEYLNYLINGLFFGAIDGTRKEITLIRLRKRKHLKDKKADWLLGPTRAANEALRHCKGDWIARNDDDDIWTPDHLEKLLRFAQQNNYEFVSASQEWQYPDRTERKTWQDDMGIMGKIGGIQTTLYRSYLKCFKFNKHCWRKNWNANNDIDLMLRMYKAGVRMGFLDEVVTIVSPRPGETEIGLKTIRKEEK